MRCPRPADDPHHVTKRTQSGRHHPDNLIGVCRRHHDQSDLAYAQGRLCIVALGQGRFWCVTVVAPDKRAGKILLANLFAARVHFCTAARTRVHP